MPSAGKIKKIKALQRAMQIEDRTYRDMLKHYNANSSTELNEFDASELIGVLEKTAISQGVWLPKPRADNKFENVVRRPGFASGKQMRKVEAMWADVSYTHDTVKRRAALDKFIRNHVKDDGLEKLLMRNVQKVITALERMRSKIEQSKIEKNKEENHEHPF